jgi:hypothetical protein
MPNSDRTRPQQQSQNHQQPEIGDGILCCILLFGAFLCFLPMIFSLELNSVFLLSSSNSNLNLLSHSFLASVAVTFPLAIDVIMNYDLPWRVILSRWIILISLIAPNLLCFLTIIPYSQRHSHDSHDNHQLKYITIALVCCSRAKQILCSGALITMYDRTVPYQRKFRIFLICLGSIANITQSFFPFVTHPALINILRIVGILSGLGVFFGFLFSCCTYFYSISKRRKESSAGLDFIGKYCLLQSLLLVLNISSKFIYGLTLLSDPKKYYSIEGILVFLFIETVTGVLAFIAPSRMAIEEAAVAKVFSSHSHPLTLPNSYCTKPRRTLFVM